MYIRQTKTSTSVAGEAYYIVLVAPSDKIEKLAQRYAAQLVAAPQSGDQQEEVKPVTFAEVDVTSLELVRSRSIGVEHVGLAMLQWLGLPEILSSAGFNGIEQAAALGSIIGRMAEPGSELATWQWLTERSALGELLDADYEAMSLMRLYRTSDLLVRHRQTIETALFSSINHLFSLPTTVTLYALTNRYFEGEVAGNAKARRGHSKEKRGDCPLLTLGLVLDGSGFVRRSRIFEGSVSETTTLQLMLEGLETPKRAMVIMDRGIASQANIDWLVEKQYRYLVVSRERARQFTAEQAVPVSSASRQTMQIQRVLRENGFEVRLYCHSQQRQEKEDAMNGRFIKRFEAGLQKIAESLTKPGGTKKRDKVLQRIGRLQEKSCGTGQHYRIDLVHAEGGEVVTALNWERTPVEGTRLTHPGVYCLRTNELNWDEVTLWQTYTMLTDLEAVFRSLKSELGMRPIYHHKEERAEGHLFITVLAYQAVQAIRRKLKGGDINDSWTSLRRIFSGQQRITATFRQKDGRTLHIRKTTVSEPKLKNLYDALGIHSSPVGLRKMVN